MLYPTVLATLALSLPASFAAPVDQYSLALGGHYAKHKSPYNLDNRDPYDRKVDSYGDGLQPEPMVTLA